MYIKQTMSGKKNIIIKSNIFLIKDKIFECFEDLLTKISEGA